MLKSQDIVILLKLVALGQPFDTYDVLAQSLRISSSEVYKGLSRAAKARLYDERRRLPVMPSLEKFVIYGVPYAFAVEPGSMVRGVPTSYAAPPLNTMMAVPSTSLLPVWPASQGTVRGYALKPLYPSVPEAAQADEHLYELLALVDALREGRARERKLAMEQIKMRFQR